MVLVQAALLGQREYAAGTSIELSFSITNFGNETVQVLKILTPLEGLLSDCLRVTRNGRRVPYQGPLLKRGTPGASDYAILYSGESLEVTLPLHTAYQVSLPGVYNIALQRPIRVVPLAGIEFHLEAQASADRRLYSLFTGVRVDVLEAATSFRVVGEGERIPTLAEQFRRKPDSSSVATSRAHGVALAPNFNGGDNASQAAVLQAHNNGYQLAANALGSMAQDSWYGQWFGDYSDSRFGAVQTHFNQVISDMESRTYTYDLTGGANCKPTIWAYTYPASDTIWICGLFWSSPSLGTDSQAGVIVHEHCHASAALDDLCYGFDPCQQYAITNPDQAVANADSHEYYARG